MTQDGNSLEAKINAMGLVLGNQVLDGANANNPATANRQLWAGTDSRLTGGLQQPFALGAGQSTITSAIFNLSGKATTGVLVNTLVNGADVTTATKALFIRVDITDDNSVVTAGSYYIQLNTIV